MGHLHLRPVPSGFYGSRYVQPSCPRINMFSNALPRITPLLPRIPPWVSNGVLIQLPTDETKIPARPRRFATDRGAHLATGRRL